MVAIGPLLGEMDAGVRTCEHLAPVERALAEAGLTLGRGRPCPHDPDWGLWFNAGALFNVPSLRRRLDPCVRYEEYESVLAGSDTTFYCTQCKRAIVGLHPRWAAPDTPHIA